MQKGTLVTSMMPIKLISDNNNGGLVKMTWIDGGGTLSDQRHLLEK